MVLCPVLGAPVQEGRELSGVSPAKGHKDDQWAGASFIAREAERAGTVFLEKRRLGGRRVVLVNVYEHLMGGHEEEGAGLFSVVPNKRTRGNGHKQKHRKCLLNLRKHPFTVGG